MLRTSATLIASFALLAACATASSNTSNSNPPADAGKVTYDVGGQPNSGGSNNGGAADPGTDAGGSSVKARDTTLTKGATVGPKVVKRVPTAKPPKPEEPATPAKPKKGRYVTPNGLLGEAFVISATDKLPDFATFSAAKAVFIAPTLDSSATAPLTVPAGVASPVALRFTGSLNVTEAAEYNLCTTSQDGSQILLESTVVVDNDGVKKDGPVELCELVALDPGEYAIEVRSFHVTGPVVLRLSWAKGKDGAQEAISTRNLYKPAGADERVKAGK